MAHIIVVIDKSGSMEVIAQTVISGFNEFLQSQNRITDESTMTLIEFSDEVQVLFANRRISDVKELSAESYLPSGMTALNDAIGEAVEAHNCTNQTLIVIITEGMENASVKYSPEVIQRLIRERTAEGWRFIYLCNNMQTAMSGASRGLSSAVAGQRNPATQNLMVDASNFGTVLARQVSDATSSYRSRGEVDSIDELSSGVYESDASRGDQTNQTNQTNRSEPHQRHSRLTRSRSVYTPSSRVPK